MVRFVVTSEEAFQQALRFIDGESMSKLREGRSIGNLFTDLYQKVEIVRERLDDWEQCNQFVVGLLDQISDGETMSLKISEHQKIFKLLVNHFLSVEGDDNRPKDQTQELQK